MVLIHPNPSAKYVTLTILYSLMTTLQPIFNKIISLLPRVTNPLSLRAPGLPFVRIETGNDLSLQQRIDQAVRVEEEDDNYAASPDQGPSPLLNGMG